MAMRVVLNEFSSFHSKLTKREQCLALFLPSCILVALMRCETTTDCACLLGTKLQWFILEAAVEVAHSLLLGGINHCQHTSDVLANDFDLGQLGGCSTGHLGDTQVGELGLKLIQLLHQFSPVLFLS